MADEREPEPDELEAVAVELEPAADELGAVDELEAVAAVRYLCFVRNFRISYAISICSSLEVTVKW